MSEMREVYRTLDKQEQELISDLKYLGRQFLDLLEYRVGNSRETSLARTKIEEAVMWAVKGITK